MDKIGGRDGQNDGDQGRSAGGEGWTAHGISSFDNTMIPERTRLDAGARMKSP
jgi:hypothetical protein